MKTDLFCIGLVPVWGDLHDCCYHHLGSGVATLQNPLQCNSNVIDAGPLRASGSIRFVRGARGSRLIYAQHVDMHGCKLFEVICRMDLEGIIAKREDGLYLPTAKWIKIKNANYTQAEGRHELFERRSGCRTVGAASQKSSRK